MPAAAAEAPTGSHHVLATKKYVLTKVISQMMIRRMRPMQRAPRLDSRPSPLRPCSNSLRSEVGIQTGANISQLFLSASGFLHLLFFLYETVFGKRPKPFPGNNVKTH